MTRKFFSLIVLLCLGTYGIATGAPTDADIARYADEQLTRNYRADAPGAAVLVARGDTVLFRAARGLADVEKHVPLKPDSVFRIGSVTKQFAAAAVLKLVEAGKVKLDDPLSKYVRDFPGGDRVTILQLLNHTSGIKSYTSIAGYMAGPIRKDLTTAQLIDAFKNEKPDFEPGTKWSYNNSGYVLVGAVIEAATGKPWYTHLEETFFKPLGMQHTGYGHDPKFASQLVHGYSYDGGKVVPMMQLSMTQPHAAGALVSTVDDLLKWNRALHEGRVLQSASYTQMITPVGKAADVNYGFGIVKGMVRKNDALMHGGGIFGFLSSLSYLPGPDVTVVVLENDDDGRSSPDGADTLARKLAAMAAGDPYPAMRAVAVRPEALREPEGVYRFSGDVMRVLRVVDGKLTAQRGGSERKVLTPIAADEFLYDDGFNRIVLERESGKIATMRFFANGDGNGEVGRRTGEPLPTAPVAVQVPRAALERLVGTYENNGLVMKVFLDGDALKSQIAGQPPVNLRATSATKFDVVEADATLEFPPGDGPATEATIRQNGRELVLKRVS